MKITFQINCVLKTKSMIDSSFKHKTRKTLRKHLATNPVIKIKRMKKCICSCTWKMSVIRKIMVIVIQNTIFVYLLYYKFVYT